MSMASRNAFKNCIVKMLVILQVVYVMKNFWPMKIPNYYACGVNCFM